jgi:hypothetical protein
MENWHHDDQRCVPRPKLSMEDRLGSASEFRPVLSSAEVGSAKGSQQSYPHTFNADANHP